MTKSFIKFVNKQCSLIIIFFFGKLCRIAESIIALVLKKPCDCCNGRNKVCNKDVEIGHKNDKHETTNKNTNKLKEENSTERTETKN